MTFRESNPGPPVRESRIVTTVLRGSQQPTSLSFYLIYVIQEETHIGRIPSEEETKAEPDPNPNANSPRTHPKTYLRTDSESHHCA